MPAFLFLALALALAGMAAASQAAARDWYSLRGVPPPQGSKVYVCHGYSCRIVTPVTLNGTDVDRIAAKLKGSGDAAAERAALSHAVQVFETIVGKRIGTDADLPGMQFGQGTPDQMDCLDEATNTTSLLKLLAAHGRLRHHAVGEPSARGFFLDGRYPHATAVLLETASSEKWAIDSWPRANAEPPVIQPLTEWKRSRSGDPPS